VIAEKRFEKKPSRTRCLPAYVDKNATCPKRRPWRRRPVGVSETSEEGGSVTGCLIDRRSESTSDCFTHPCFFLAGLFQVVFPNSTWLDAPPAGRDAENREGGGPPRAHESPVGWPACVCVLCLGRGGGGWLRNQSRPISAIEVDGSDQRSKAKQNANETSL